MRDRVLYRSFAGRIVLEALVRIGYWQFVRSGRTPHVSYASFRKLHCATRGEINRHLSDVIARGSTPLAVGDPSGLLGDREAVESVLESVRRDGYAICPRPLDAASCAALVAFATTTPANRVPPISGDPSPAVFDPTHPLAPRYQFDESALITEPIVRRLLGDASLIELAARYFGAPPVNDLVTMWWSAPFGAPSSAAAQLFHFDMDRIRFLKVFVYLTDVDADTGPHVFVRGSHRHKPEQFFRDRRFTDAEVAAAFPSDDIRELTGPAGTVIVADTSGLHKGKALVRGLRLLFQLELANSLFGQSYERHAWRAVGSDDPLAAAVRRFPGVLQRFHAEAR